MVVKSCLHSLLVRLEAWAHRWWFAHRLWRSISQFRFSSSSQSCPARLRWSFALTCACNGLATRTAFALNRRTTPESTPREESTKKKSKWKTNGMAKRQTNLNYGSDGQRNTSNICTLRKKLHWHHDSVAVTLRVRYSLARCSYNCLVSIRCRTPAFQVEVLMYLPVCRAVCLSSLATSALRSNWWRKILYNVKIHTKKKELQLLKRVQVEELQLQININHSEAFNLSCKIRYQFHTMVCSKSFRCFFSSSSWSVASRHSPILSNKSRHAWLTWWMPTW